MNVWIVNPFDPLPGDPEQEGRYATLVRLLRHAGHQVMWWTSSFSHRFKRPVDQHLISETCHHLGMAIRFLEVPAYRTNVSVARLRNHYLLARRFAASARHEDSRPDVVIASIPPPMLARAACRLAHRLGTKTIVDVQDLWPETFFRLGPRFAKPLLHAAFRPWARAAKETYRTADSIVGVADEYVDRAIDLGASRESAITIPLGVDLAAFDAAARNGRCEEFTKAQGQIWLAYTGSLNRSYDPLTIIRAVGSLTGKASGKIRLFVTGRGHLAGQAKQIIRNEGHRNIVMTGFLDFDKWAYLLSQCDVGFNASLPEALIYLPNKIFYYFAAGLAVLNTIPGQCSRIISDGKCGLDYCAANVYSCSQAIRRAVDDIECLRAMGTASRRLATTTYDRKVIYPGYVNFIERIAGRRYQPSRIS